MVREYLLTDCSGHFMKTKQVSEPSEVTLLPGPEPCPHTLLLDCDLPFLGPHFLL